MATETDEDVGALLADVIEQLDCVSGTVHRLTDGTLQLIAQEGLPEDLVGRIERIPIGKGMAGIAAEREEPVQVCNLQTDDLDVAAEGARTSGMEGSIAAPIFDANGELRGTVGVAKPEEHEFTPEERDALLDAGERIARRFD